MEKIRRFVITEFVKLSDEFDRYQVRKVKKLQKKFVMIKIINQIIVGLPFKIFEKLNGQKNLVHKKLMWITMQIFP